MPTFRMPPVTTSGTIVDEAWVAKAVLLLCLIDIVISILDINLRTPETNTMSLRGLALGGGLP